MALKLPRYDAVVVGAGAGGAAAAWRLTAHGLKVLVLEAGPRFDPARDYRLARPDWERSAFPEKRGSRGRVSFAPLQALDPAHAGLLSWNRAFGRTNPGTQREPAGPGYFHVRGVGGSTLHFVGEAHRLNPAAMQLQSEFGVGADWPLSYAELEPYYCVAENLVGVAGPADAGARWRSMPYPLPPHRLCRASERLAAAGRALGQQWHENPRAALSRAYDGRPPCNYCANCSRGCPLGDKGSADVSFIRHAEHGGCTVRENARVLQIETRGRRVVAVRFRVGTQVHRAETPQLLLACGAIETPRLLLDQASRSQPHGLANSSGQVGKNLMETLAWTSVGLAEDDLRSWAGLPADAICWDYNHPRAIPGTVGGCRFNSATQEIGLVGPIAQATRLVRGFGANLKAQVRAGFGHALAVGGVAEYLPNPGTFVDLDPTRRDADGRPLARLHLRLEAGEIARLHFMAAISRKLLAAAGIRERVEESSSYDRVAATHVFGTCRMGTDGSDSVVDTAGQAYDFDNLAIVDASVFPSSGGGESPSLTIQALAIRAADRIALGCFLPPSVAPVQPSRSINAASIRPASI